MKSKLFVVLLLMAAPAVAQDRATYKNASLGMTMQEWRALPFPNPEISGPAPFSLCSNQTGLPAGVRMPVTQDETDAGVIVCQYWQETMRRGALGMKMFFQNKAYMPIGKNYVMEPPVFKFLDGSLYSISGVSELGALEDVLSGLTARYGKPATITDGTVQNKVGNAFPSKTYTWDLGADLISVDAPGGGRVDTLTVVYVNKEAAKKRKELKSESNPDINKM